MSLLSLVPRSLGRVGLAAALVVSSGCAKSATPVSTASPSPSNSTPNRPASSRTRKVASFSQLV